MRFGVDSLKVVGVNLRFGVLDPLNVSTATPSKPNELGAALRLRLADDFPIPSEPGVVMPELSTVVA